MHHLWYNLMQVLGVNNGFNPISTRWYNFWSGFGGNLAFVLAGLAVAITFIRRAEKRLLDLFNKPTDF